MGRILAIDYGQKRVGFAVTDELQICANALDTIPVAKAFDFLKQYLQQEKVDVIVIGEPRKLDNTPSDSTRFIDPFVNRLRKELPNISPDTTIARMDGKWWFLLYTLLIWGCYYTQLYIASWAFSFTQDLGALAVLVLFVLSSIGMAVPSNGGLGPWQFAIIFGLSLYGVGAFPPTTPYDAQASAFSWLVWGVQQLLIIVLGIFAFACIAFEKKTSQP